ncbi:Tuberous sclerosis 2 [Candida viswanathii]|uniref:Tuberous sclerosis 2 n=1 Tax=Candida viswanathii TaxID=5486 RepID=A0A367XT55_9ASCO|nr:Tuberous sclerosis 2 [Candida viswanathii]
MSTYHPSFVSSNAGGGSGVGSGSGGGGGLGSVFKSITKTFKTSSSRNVPVTINPTVVGGGQELQHTIQQLETTTSNSTRLAALNKLTDSIYRYLISSVPEIWYLVHHYCEYNSAKYSRDVRRAALRLLTACIKKDENSGIGSRVRYFNDINMYCMFEGSSRIDPDYDLFLEALIALTNDGRDIHDFVIYEDRSNLNMFLENSLSVMIESLSGYGYESDEKIEELRAKDRNFRNILGIIEFTTNCIKFNYATFNETMLVWIIKKLIDTESKNKQILVAVIECFNSVLIYGRAPIDCVPDTLRFLTIIYGSSIDTELNSLVWKCANNIYVEDSFQIVIMSLCDNIANPDLNPYKVESSEGIKMMYACIGSIRLLRQFQARAVSQKHNLLEMALFDILRAYKVALSSGISQINNEILDCFDKLLAKEAYPDNFGVAFTGSMDKVFPFHLWYSTNSIYDLLNLLQVSNDQERGRLQSICLSLQSLYESQELPTPKDKLIDFFTNFMEYLPLATIIFVLQYYDDEKMCSLLNPFWKENSMKILSHFYFNKDADVTVRVRCLQVILNSYTTSLAIFNDEDVKYEIIIEILKRSLAETNEEVLHYLVDKLFGEILLKCPGSVFNQLSSIVVPLFQDTPEKSTQTLALDAPTMARSFISSANNTSTAHDEPNTEIQESIAKLFCTTLVKSPPRRAQECYDTLIQIANLSKANSGVLLIIAKCFVRIRTTTENFIYFTEPSDMGGLAAAFKRDNSSVHSGQWSYPETVDYLPQQHFNTPNRRLLLQVDSEENESDKSYIDIQKWLQLALYIMENFVEWEVYSYVCAHFVGQLSNMQLFYHCDAEISKLRAVLCDQLALKLPASLKFPKDSDLTRADLQVVFVRSFSSFIGYHEKFTKSDQDHIINSLLIGAGSWEKTAIPCINILTVCCYESPLSIMKFLNSILTKLQTKITSVNSAAHTLEFLIALAEVPKLTTNFTVEDFKQGFGIAFKYIQYAKDLEKRKIQSLSSSSSSTSPKQLLIQAHGVDAEVEQAPLTQQQEITPAMTQYILMLSYDVVASWFVTLKLNDRKVLLGFVIKNLKLCNENSEELDDFTIGLLDLITRFTSTDMPLEMGYNATKKFNNAISVGKWMVDNSVVSIETDSVRGNTEVLIRKPTGVYKFNISLDHPAILKNTSPMVLPTYFLLQLIESNAKSQPEPIPDDTDTNRAISVLDRIPSVEFHKVGIVYIGKNQSSENEVFSNRIGSPDYQKFLLEIGDLLVLKGCRNVYTGGLDTENNMDGEFTRYWRGKFTQMIFHVVTMMNNEQQPCQEGMSDIEAQRLIDLKKRHIGNNYVNIFFDESGNDFNFNLIKSQFNFLSIVISPHTISHDYTITSPSPTSTAFKKSHTTSSKFFKVKTYRRGGIPSLFGTSHYKLISETELPTFIRTTAILANIFANTWHGGRLVWEQRVKQLKLIASYSKKNT